MVEMDARSISPRSRSAPTTSSSRPAIFRSQSISTPSSGGRPKASRTSPSVRGSRRAASPQSWATRSGGAPGSTGPAGAWRQSLPSENPARGRSPSGSIISTPAVPAASKLSSVLPGRIESAPLWPIRFKRDTIFAAPHMAGPATFFDRAVARCDSRVVVSDLTGWERGREFWIAIAILLVGALAIAASAPAATTVTLVKDVRPGGANSDPGGFTELAANPGTVLFEASDGMHGGELWETDGSAAGTRLVKDIKPIGSSDPFGFTNFAGRLFFSADDGTHGGEPPRPDAAAAVAKLVHDGGAGSGDSGPGGLTSAAGKLFFVANDGTHGEELWESDGTAAGTKLVKDINPGSARSAAAQLRNFAGKLFLRADDGMHGIELWESDGTAAGTKLVKDIDPGSGESLPF